MKRLITLLAALLAMSVPVFGTSITITLNPSVETYPPGAASFLCQQAGTAPCVIFSGTVTDTDTDNSFLFLNSVALDPTVPADSFFTVDNTFFNDVPGLFSGDPTWATDNLGNPSNTYTGPLFGLDFSASIPGGVYDGIAIFSVSGGTNDSDNNGFTVNVPFEVVVATPEPASGLTILAGLLVTGAARRRARRIAEQ